MWSQQLVFGYARQYLATLDRKSQGESKPNSNSYFPHEHHGHVGKQLGSYLFNVGATDNHGSSSQVCLPLCVIWPCWGVPEWCDGCSLVPAGWGTSISPGTNGGGLAWNMTKQRSASYTQAHTLKQCNELAVRV